MSSQTNPGERRMDALSRRLDHLEERLSEAEREIEVLRCDKAVPGTSTADSTEEDS